MNNSVNNDQEHNQDDSDSDVEEVEPRLKYIRMRNDLDSILQNDAASCIAVHPKFLCLGTHWGMIHILDHKGNIIRSKTLQAHTVAVNQISIDQNGDFIGSCSDDGKVVIYGLYSTENNHNMSMERLVKSIALDPYYYKTGSGRRFLTVSAFQVDFYISGIAPLENQLVILGCPKEPDETGNSQRPMLHVVEPKYLEYTAICATSLTLRGYKEYSCNDYHLDCLIDENRYFIVSPKDIVVASLYDADDRIEWLLTHGKFELALETVTANGGKDCKKHSLIYVGRVYLDHLLAHRKYNEAGKLCLKVLERDKKLWEEEVYKFARVHQLRSISSYLPRGDVTLRPEIYEMVLYEYLKTDPDGFLQLVKEWSPKLYNVVAVINGIREHLSTQENGQNVLLEALAILYTHQNRYDESLAIYLKLKHKDVFQLIQKHKLYNSVHDMIEGLMDLDAERAIAFFLEKNRVPSEIVVAKLQKNHRYLHMYLDALDKKDTKDSKGKYHGLLVRLYADFSRDKLLPLLRRSDNYPIEQALEICRQKQFYPEMVYLLGRIGNTSEALALMTQELNDMEGAIEFCQVHDDDELWNNLVNYSLDKPEAITFLLQRIGTYMDPRLILQKIEPRLEIPGLKNALVKMMCDYNLQISVQEGCNKILSNDHFNLHEKLVRSHQKGICTDDDHMCRACHQKIIIREPRNLVMFYCRHSFHEDCLRNINSLENCVICNPQKPAL
ncbi:vacuolar protein sorting-associated protein 41 homolog isoform X3 [Diprion similis]|uniref:vacuolar protein sorting-associated protein 41 homolog isoform X3 n=1 Tax=Diprion similis TaxID=362088 RepID=UPI001EF8CC9F|nr:vacuolar protein sorting-associated protein 41 homolog isoform X3 [Diprion similis]